jgi:transcriptional regulator with XRE-family HTH domain
MDYTKIVACNIRNARLYRNYSQDYLASKLKISQNAFSKIELGRTKISIDRLFIIAEVLQVPLLQLIEPGNKLYYADEISRVPLVDQLLEMVCISCGKPG